ncbi:GDP-fucose transporter 1 [Canna indica]|uniref:GDP-fucose transporter 1 n=1 Tax=Canna indica TaxID=4628 RepID=A0AAQ3K560_9LILI|nr:GDP-fucose transporter 1 [Canna indica]
MGFSISFINTSINPLVLAIASARGGGTDETSSFNTSAMFTLPSKFDDLTEETIASSDLGSAGCRHKSSSRWRNTTNAERMSSYYTTVGLVIRYSLSSSLLTIINKYAITEFSYLGLLTALQYVTTKLGVLYHNPFTLDNAKKFLPSALVFYLVIFTKTNLLRHANVDTFIVFRSLTPLLVAIDDTVFRSQPCPSKLAFLSLLIILSGAVGYVANDSAFSLTAYSWAAAYLVTITTEMVYIKHMVTNLGFNT